MNDGISLSAHEHAAITSFNAIGQALEDGSRHPGRCNLYPRRYLLIIPAKNVIGQFPFLVRQRPINIDRACLLSAKPKFAETSRTRPLSFFGNFHHFHHHGTACYSYSC